MNGASRSCRFLTLLVATLLGVVQTAWAQMPADAIDSETLFYRRIMVLEDQIPEMANGHLPIKRDEFQRLLQVAKQHDEQRRNARTSIRVAEYEVTLNDEQATEGMARLTIEHDGQEPGLLFLSPSDLPIRNAVWFDKSPQPAKVGTNPNGQTLVIVEKSGELRFDWSLRSQRKTAEAIEFQVTLPPAAVNRLTVNAPASWQLKSDRGVLSKITTPTNNPNANKAAENKSLADKSKKDAAKNSPNEKPAADKKNDNGNTAKKSGSANRISGNTSTARQFWRLELGGENRITFQATTEATNDRSGPSLYVRQNDFYEVTSTGLQLRTNFRLDLREPHPRSLVVEASAGLTPVQVSLGEKRLAWNTVAEESNGTTRLEIVFPEPLSGNNRLLRVTAVTASSLDAKQSLPKLRLENAEWQEGEATLFLQDPLQLQNLELLDSRLTHQGTVAVPQPGKTWQLQYLSRDAEIRPHWIRPSTELRASQGTTINVDATTINARTVVELTAHRGAVFELLADIAAEWLVDEVATVPAEALDDYEISNVENSAQRLRVALRQPITGKQGLRLLVRGHRRRPAENTALTTAQLRLCEPRDVTFRSRLMSLSTEAGARLELTGDSTLSRVETSRLTIAEAKLIEPRPGALIWIDDDRARATSVRVRAEGAQFSTDASVTARVTSSTVRESYELDVVPDASAVGKLLLNFSVARESNLEWSLEGFEDSPVSARRLSLDQMKNLAMMEGEVWEITLDPPLAIPFRLLGERTSPFTSDDEVSLVMFPEADSQFGSVTVMSDGVRIRVHSESITPSPIEPPAADRFQTALAAFRYEPGEQSRVRIERCDEPPLTGAWAWAANYEVIVYPRRSTIFEASLLLENSGATSLEFELPPLAVLEGWSLDEQPLASHVVRDGVTQRHVVALPAEKRFPRLQVRYSIPANDFAVFNDLHVALPAWKFPVLKTSGTLWLPPGISSPPIDARSVSPSERFRSAVQRLFGPLLRNSPNLAAANENQATAPAITPRTSEKSLSAEKNPANIVSHVLLISPWMDDPNTDHHWRLRAGWSSSSLSLGGHKNTIVPLQKDSVVLAISAALLLMATALMAWGLARGSSSLAVTMLFTFAIGALLMPAMLVPLARAAWWGGWLGMALHLSRRSAPVPAEPTSTSSTITRFAVANVRSIWFLLVAAGAVNSLRSFADEPKENRSPNADTVVYRVVEPVNEEQKPVGDYVYLPRDFYHSLRRRASLDRQASQGWLITSANYSGSLRLQANEDRLELAELVAQFELEITRPGIEVVLPFVREQMNLVAERSTLNGQSLTLDWDDAGRGLTFTAGSPGNYTLEFAMHPIGRTQMGTRGFDLKIPRTSQAALRLQVPNDAAQVRVPSARGGITLDQTSGLLHAELGPAEMLSLQWSAGAVGERDYDATVEELLWMEVRPGAVVLETRLNVTPLDGVPLRSLTVAIDSRWSLLPWENESVTVTDLQEDEVRKLRFDFAEPPTQMATLRPSFMLSKASGVGNLRMPRVESLRCRVARRWGAVSSGSGMELDIASSSPLESVGGDEFQAAWGIERHEPRFAFRLRSDEATPLVTTRPQVTTLKASFVGDLVVESDFTELQLTYSVAPPEGNLFSHRITIPKQFEPRSVSVMLNGEDRLDRWIRDGEESLTLFLQGPVAAGHDVQVIGRVPMSMNGRSKIDLPKLSVDEEVSSLIRVWRRPTANVAPEANPAWQTTSDESPNRNLVNQARLVATLRPVENVEPVRSITLRVTPNRPRIGGNIATICRRQEQWEAELDCRLNVETGVLDELRFEVPSDWVGPFTSETLPATSTLTTIPGQSRRWLVVRPEEPLRGSCRLRIRGQLTSNAGELERAPRIVPLDMPRVERLLLLPSSIRNQRVEWETSFVQRLSANSDWPWEELPQADWIAYRQLGPRSRAVLRRVETSLGTPRVRLADFSLAAARESTIGLAAFDIEPSGATSAVLEIPPALRLVHLSVEGVSPLAEPLNNGRWSFPLVSDQLSQRVEVLFSADITWNLSASAWSSSAEAMSSPLPLPRLVDWPVARTLISVAGELVENSGDEELSLAAEELALQQWRDRSVSLAIKLADESSAVERLPNGKAWRTLWETRYAAYDPREDATPSAPTTDSLFRTIAFDSTVHFGNFGGELLQLPLRLAPTPTSDLQWRWILAAAVGLLAFLFIVPGMLERMLEWFAEILPATSVLTGIVWWTWFVFPWLGLLPILLGLMIAWRRNSFCRS